MLGKIFCKSAIGGLASSVLLASVAVADAGDFTLKLEPGLTVPLTKPQSEIYDVGGGLSVKGLFGLNPYLDIGPSVSFHLLPAEEELAESGGVWGLGGGLRLKRPRSAESSRFSPWADADLLYVRSGELNRPGFDMAGGLAWAVGESRAYWVGPFVRYLHVIQPKRDGYENSDAKLLSLGLSVEFGSGVERAAPEERVTAEAYQAPACPSACPDGDQDGVPDSVDRCLEVAGTSDDYGCPSYERVVVKPDKLELKENIYFAWNSAELEPSSHAVLDDVARALKDNKAFRVQLEGHADSSGGDDINQGLSERRADAVKDYLVSHGVEPERLIAKGFSSSVPTGDNTTVQGREDNRRVEFVVHFIILNDGSQK